MSNDLISRSEVLKTLEYVFNKYNMAWDKHGGFAEEVPETIRNLPTAYDVDKVVEQIENKMFSAEVYNDDMNGVQINNLLCMGDVYEIVKEGGISDNN